jgi:tetratricopeptide (TPR) repeat protein
MHNHITTSYLNTLRKAGTLLLLLIFFTPLFAQQSATYDESIVLADKNYKEKRYLDAKAYYQMALKYKSGDAYAKEQIATIVEKLKAGQDKEDAYFDMVDLDDVFYEEGELEKALAQYKKALTLIPDDEYALRKIADIQRVLTEERDRINAYNKSMEEGNALMAKNDYTQAIEAFKNALILFPSEAWRPKK